MIYRALVSTHSHSTSHALPGYNILVYVCVAEVVGLDEGVEDGRVLEGLVHAAGLVQPSTLPALEDEVIGLLVFDDVKYGLAKKQFV